MREEKLLEAIGEIDDRLIEEAAPGKKKKVIHINWFRYGSIAACFLLVIILAYGASTIRMGSKEESAADAAAPEEFIQEDTTVEESAIEEEAAAEAPAETEEAPAEEEAPEGEVPAEEAPAEDAPAEEEGPAEETNPTDNENAVVDIAYGITVNDRIYFPISFEERKQFGLVPEDAVGLTPENTYQISDADLGEVIGVITDCEKEEYIGLKLYHFAEYPENDVIGILDNNGTYEFYVCDELLADSE